MQVHLIRQKLYITYKSCGHDQQIVDNAEKNTFTIQMFLKSEDFKTVKIIVDKAQDTQDFCGKRQDFCGKLQLNTTIKCLLRRY